MEFLRTCGQDFHPPQDIVEKFVEDGERGKHYEGGGRRFSPNSAALALFYALFPWGSGFHSRRVMSILLGEDRGPPLRYPARWISFLCFRNHAPKASRRRQRVGRGLTPAALQNPPEKPPFFHPQNRLFVPRPHRTSHATHHPCQEPPIQATR